MNLDHMIIRWDLKKDEELQSKRMIGFRDIILAMKDNRILDILEHPNKNKYPNQMLLIVEINNYAYVVPFEIRNDIMWLITVYPSRKMTKIYLGGKYGKEKS